MQFDTEDQREWYERIKAWMADEYGDVDLTQPDEPVLGPIGHDSASASIIVAPGGGGEGALISIFSWVVTGAEPSKELFEYLLRANANRAVGAFHIDENNDILLRHVLLDDQLTKDVLMGILTVVAKGADEHDDEIVKRFGGRRYEDRVAAARASESSQTVAGSPEAGWYKDPQGVSRLRWWDGNRWTDHTAE